MRRSLLVLCALFLMFSACTKIVTPVAFLPPSSPVDDEDGVITEPQETEERPTESLPESIVIPEPLTKYPEMIQAVAILQNDVEDVLSLDRNSLTLISIEKKTWRDASLGCPKQGMVYAQILTDGWLVVYEGPEGEEIPVHTDGDLQNYKICDIEIPPSSWERFGDEDVNAILKAATTFLSEEIGVRLENIGVTDITSKSWNNSCLGCAESEEKCLAVITPGYEVLLDVNGKMYVIHTNADGAVQRLCPKPDNSNPDGS